MLRMFAIKQIKYVHVYISVVSNGVSTIGQGGEFNATRMGFRGNKYVFINSNIKSTDFILVGPLVGGLLSRPCENFEGLCSAHSIFWKFPYLLPNLFACLVLFLSQTFILPSFSNH